jgi:Tfp pilus assembly protein PilE
MKKVLIKNRQQGFGIISVILGIVASAVLILLGFQQYQQAMMKIKIGSAQTQFQDISTGIDSLYANFHDFTKITTKVVIDAGIVSKDNLVGETIASPWYSKSDTSIVTIKPAALKTSYIVTMAGVPKDACSGVASMFLNNSKSNMKVNNTLVSDPAELAVACVKSENAEIAINF